MKQADTKHMFREPLFTDTKHTDSYSFYFFFLLSRFTYLYVFGYSQRVKVKPLNATSPQGNFLIISYQSTFCLLVLLFLSNHHPTEKYNFR